MKRDLFVITDGEGRLMEIYTNKGKALESVKPYQEVELWQYGFAGSYEYEGNVTE